MMRLRELAWSMPGQSAAHELAQLLARLPLGTPNPLISAGPAQLVPRAPG